MNGDRAETPTLRIRDLSISYGDPARPLRAVRNVSLDIAPGEAYGLIGESGSGKSTLAFAVMGHVANGRIDGGGILFQGRDLGALTPREWRELRGNRIAMVYQDPMNALNPAIRLGEQVAETLRRHKGLSRTEAWAQAVDLFAQVHLPDPASIARRYPHQISGGQQQRVVIAMAIACKAQLLIMDEPTTGLDVTTEARILELIGDLRRRLGMSILFISHNLRVVGRVCDRVGILYAGELIEEGPVAAVLERPGHPYAIGLRAALPEISGPLARRLASIPGRLPDLRDVPEGCIFAARCHLAEDRCLSDAPPVRRKTPLHFSRCIHLHPPQPAFAPAGRDPRTAEDGRATAKTPLLATEGLGFSYRRAGAIPFLRRPDVAPAVDDVSLELLPNRTLGIVGESGSGKSTLARCVAGLLAPTAGDIRFHGETLERIARRRRPQDRRGIQIVFQNPESALNPSLTVGDIVSRPLRLYRIVPGERIRRRTVELLEMVNLGERYWERFPHELSGGEKQRVNIARALGAEPDIVICDEPTSALDISVQASVLNTLADLRDSRAMAYLFITHDLGVVRYISDTVAVMSRGKVVEAGPTRDIFERPGHAYTRQLLAALGPDLTAGAPSRASGSPHETPLAEIARTLP
ncbi:MAG: dipeptide ABC transporter ATP-binding protein [Pseudochelatococcus sp.]|jgi:peptide/nickel transport system ATP-binding protein|uniref:dipeptide ABC transporter ATP-binding protein n=1 Tax=Pseudochelatococcus sp. TaxID=2020869 RepID=UPI003D8ACD62